MPVNRNALIRYKTIDICLQNRYRKWTLNDLIEACSEALYEYEGIEKGVSKRTVQMDLQMMRSDKLGYNAPIIVVEKKYYTYEDPTYSITNIPLTDQDLGKLTEVVEILKQFKGFTHFQELRGIVQRLEDKIYTSKTDHRSIIDLEKNENLKGLEHIDFIYRAIQRKEILQITYQSFKAKESSSFPFHPFLLKEYRNRWFVLGKKKEKLPYMLLALDRVIDLQYTGEASIEVEEVEIRNFFRDVVGVTVNTGDKPQEVILFIDAINAPYVLTKPIHHSQKVLEERKNGIIISLEVKLNYELEREILGFGDKAKVIAPEQLKQRVRARLFHALDQYRTELKESELIHYPKKIAGKGYIVAPNIYTKKELNKMGLMIQQYEQTLLLETKNIYPIHHLFKVIPALKAVVMNRNLKRILSSIGSDYYLTKALYYDKPPQGNSYIKWHQELTVDVHTKILTDSYDGWTTDGAFVSLHPPVEVLHEGLILHIHLDEIHLDQGVIHVIPGSHQKRLTEQEIQPIAEQANPFPCEVNAGGLIIFKPLLLHAYTKSTYHKKRRVLHLELNRIELPDGLEWGEKEDC